MSEGNQEKLNQLKQYIERVVQRRVSEEVKPLTDKINTLTELCDRLLARVEASQQYEQQIHDACAEAMAAARIVETQQGKIDQLVALQLMDLPNHEKRLTKMQSDTAKLSAMIERVGQLDRRKGRRDGVFTVPVASKRLPDTQA